MLACTVTHSYRDPDAFYVGAPHLVAVVRAGARFENGKLIERPDDQPDHDSGGHAHAA
jgi:putative transposase